MIILCPLVTVRAFNEGSINDEGFLVIIYLTSNVKNTVLTMNIYLYMIGKSVEIHTVCCWFRSTK